MNHGRSIIKVEDVARVLSPELKGHFNEVSNQFFSKLESRFQNQIRDYSSEVQKVLRVKADKLIESFELDQKRKEKFERELKNLESILFATFSEKVEKVHSEEVLKSQNLQSEFSNYLETAFQKSTDLFQSQNGDFIKNKSLSSRHEIEKLFKRLIREFRIEADENFVSLTKNASNLFSDLQKKTLIQCKEIGDETISRCVKTLSRNSQKGMRESLENLKHHRDLCRDQFEKSLLSLTNDQEQRFKKRINEIAIKHEEEFRSSSENQSKVLQEDFNKTIKNSKILEIANFQKILEGIHKGFKEKTQDLSESIARETKRVLENDGNQIKGEVLKEFEEQSRKEGEKLLQNTFEKLSRASAQLEKNFQKTCEKKQGLIKDNLLMDMKKIRSGEERNFQNNLLKLKEDSKKQNQETHKYYQQKLSKDSERQTQKTIHQIEKTSSSVLERTNHEIQAKISETREILENTKNLFENKMIQTLDQEVEMALSTLRPNLKSQVYSTLESLGDYSKALIEKYSEEIDEIHSADLAEAKKSLEVAAAKIGQVSYKNQEQRLESIASRHQKDFIEELKQVVSKELSSCFHEMKKNQDLIVNELRSTTQDCLLSELENKTEKYSESVEKINERSLANFDQAIEHRIGEIQNKASTIEKDVELNLGQVFVEKSNEFKMMNNDLQKKILSSQKSFFEQITSENLEQEQHLKGLYKTISEGIKDLSTSINHEIFQNYSKMKEELSHIQLTAEQDHIEEIKILKHELDTFKESVSNFLIQQKSFSNAEVENIVSARLKEVHQYYMTKNNKLELKVNQLNKLILRLVEQKTESRRSDLPELPTF
ncbi:MAG: hypothetical protein ACPGJV_08415 [Bacteriovoracaceae bacterium]